MIDAIVADLRAQTSDNDLPIFVRLSAAILRQIVLANTSDGAALPSLRILAKRAGLAHRTVHAAYARLAAQGIVATRRCHAPYLASSALARQYLQASARRALSSALSDRRALGDLLDLAAFEAAS